MKKLIVLFLILLFFKSKSQIPEGYYNFAEGKTGEELRYALFQIINNNVVQLSYSSLWNCFKSTDRKPNGKVWDIYSDIPGGSAPYEYDFFVNQCGNYDSEGDCYNREHTVPASWFNDNYPMYSDLFHILPADGYVNNKRANYPYGNVTSAIWTSMNGSKLGYSNITGYYGPVFEPIDSFKGDIARIYFYMATRYLDRIPQWNSVCFQNNNLTPWAVQVFLQWHQLDPVSAKEKIRNDSVFVFQGNRNPFVDHPEWVELIWGTSDFKENNYQLINVFSEKGNIIFNNKTNKTLIAEVYSSTCNLYKNLKINSFQTITINLNTTGIFFVRIYNNDEVFFRKILLLQ